MENTPRLDWRRRVRALERWVSRHRRAVVLALLAIAAVNLVSRLAPGPTAPVLVAARPVASGATLTAADVRVERWPRSLVGQSWPTSAAAAVGRTTSGAMAAGDPITPSRFAGRTSATPGTVLAPVRIADAASATLVKAGDLIDVLAAWPAGTSGPATATAVATRVRVVSVPQRSAAGTGYDGALLMVEVPPGTATRIAAAAVSARLSVVIHPE